MKVGHGMQVQEGWMKRDLLVVLRCLQLASHTGQCGGILWPEASKARHLPLPHRPPRVWRPLPSSREQALMEGVQIVGHAIRLPALGLLQHCSRRRLLLRTIYMTQHNARTTGHDPRKYHCSSKSLANPQLW